MSSVHTIRLAGPWELHADGSSPERVTLPAELPAGDETACLLRKFHRPSGLEQNCEVRIVLCAHPRPLSVRLNEQVISTVDPSSNSESAESAYDVTTLLQPFNSLRVQAADSHPSSGGVLQTAVLEIREPGNP